jgi:TraY domain
VQRNRGNGRPKVDWKPGDRVSVSWRLKYETNEMLNTAAKRSGRSKMQEIEHLIELGLIFETLMAFGNRQLFDKFSDEKEAAE